jgi:hypothetical protein
MIPRRALLALGLSACAPVEVARPRPPSQTPSPVVAPVEAPSTGPPRSALREAIDLSAEYLVRSCREDGSFVYSIHLEHDDLDDDYNVLRHAGAIYALADYHARWPSPDTAAAILRARDNLRSFMAPLPERPEIWAIWSHDDPREAKLGGAGLALVALDRLEERQRLARFVAFMQKPDGGFHSKFFARRGFDAEWVSLYYPGEAALGLAMLHEDDPAGGWGEIAKRALLFLAGSRRHEARVPADHWALIASERLLRDSGDLFATDDREAIVAHSRQVVSAMLAARPDHAPNSPRRGSFTIDGRTTPTATRLEGLLAARGHVALAELEGPMDAAIDDGIDFLSRAIVRDGEHRGAMPRAIARIERFSPTGSFNRRAMEVRVDYVQHALSAFLGHLDRRSAHHE